MKVAPKPKSIVVPDASVILKWILIEGDDCSQALQLRDDFLNERVELFVPSHFFFEIGNILGRKWPNQALRFISELRMANFSEFVLNLDLTSIALKLMKKHSKISFYDAAYHALALQHKGVFITADEQYFKSMQKEGAIGLLKDYGNSKTKTLKV